MSKLIINRYDERREHLKCITEGLRKMADAAGRTDYTDNQLLLECYNLIHADMDTSYGWAKRGYQIQPGQHPYLFWNYEIETIEEDGFGRVMFLYAIEQMEYTK